MDLYRVMGKRFLCVTIMIEHVIQAFIAGGGSGGLIGAPIFLLLSKTGLPAARMQILESVAVSSWQLKPLIGILSDSLYIGGYNRMPYMIGSAILGIVSSLGLVSLYPVSPNIFALLLFFIFLPIATCDLLLEAGYVEKIRDEAKVRPTLHSFIRFVSGVCELASIAIVGILIKRNFPLQWLYLSPILPYAILALMIYANWGDEPVVYERERSLTNSLCCNICWTTEREDATTVYEFPFIGHDSIKIRENWRIFLLALIIGLISLSMSIIGLLELSTTILFAASLCASLTMIVCYFLLLDRPIAKILTFTVIQNMFSISLRAATFFFYTDPPEAYPAGPHFSKEFYVTIMGGIGILVSMFGVLLYTTFMYDWTYRRIFRVTSILFIITCIPNILLFTRWNVKVGIPDTVFVLGSEVVQVVVGQLNSMPYGVMMLALCPPPIAATLYAIMAGSNNLGGAFASYQGAFVLEQLSITPTGNLTGESKQFDNLWIASLISLCIQIIPLIFIHILIPDVKQTDNLIESEYHLTEE